MPEIREGLAFGFQRKIPTRKEEDELEGQGAYQAGESFEGGGVKKGRRERSCEGGGRGGEKKK